MEPLTGIQRMDACSLGGFPSASLWTGSAAAAEEGGIITSRLRLSFGFALDSVRRRS